MDLPTYTNIWRIEKRLYKLYDLRLPMPLPLVQIGVFAGVFVPWIVLLRFVGIPFESPWHVLYVVPPGVLTWLATRPVIEGKRLTELLLSHSRYLAEPRTWCRLTPIREPREVVIVARVWRRPQAPAPVAAAERAAVKSRRKARKARKARPLVEEAPLPQEIAAPMPTPAMASAPQPLSEYEAQRDAASAPREAAPAEERPAKRSRKRRFAKARVEETAAEATPGDAIVKATPPALPPTEAPLVRAQAAHTPAEEPQAAQPVAQAAEQPAKPRSAAQPWRRSKRDIAHEDDAAVPPGLPAETPADLAHPPATPQLEVPPQQPADKPASPTVGSGKRAFASGVRRPGGAVDFWQAIAPPAPTDPAPEATASTPAPATRPDIPQQKPAAETPEQEFNGEPGDVRVAGKRKPKAAMPPVPFPPPPPPPRPTAEVPQPPQEPEKPQTPATPEQQPPTAETGQPANPSQPAEPMPQAPAAQAEQPAPAQRPQPAPQTPAAQTGQPAPSQPVEQPTPQAPASQAGQPAPAQRPEPVEQAAPQTSATGAEQPKPAQPSQPVKQPMPQAPAAQAEQPVPAQRPQSVEQPAPQTPAAQAGQPAPAQSVEESASQVPAARTEQPAPAQPSRPVEQPAPQTPATQAGQSASGQRPRPVEQSAAAQAEPVKAGASPQESAQPEAAPQVPAAQAERAERRDASATRYDIPQVPSGTEQRSRQREQQRSESQTRQDLPQRPGATRRDIPQMPAAQAGEGVREQEGAPARPPAPTRPDIPMVPGAFGGAAGKRERQEGEWRPAKDPSREPAAPEPQKPAAQGSQPPKPQQPPKPWSKGLSKPVQPAGTDAMVWPPVPSPRSEAGKPEQQQRPTGPQPGRFPTQAPPPRPPQGTPVKPEPPRPHMEPPLPVPDEEPPPREVRSGPASPVRPRPLPPPPAAPQSEPAITPPDPEHEVTAGGLRRLIHAVGGGHGEADAEYQLRLQQPFQGTRHIVVLGCTGGAGQTVTALMLGHTFAQHNGEPVVAIDVNPGPGALARRTRSETNETLTGLITRADQVNSLTAMRRYTSQAKSGLDVIAAGKNPLQALDDRDYALAIRTIDRFYSVTLLDAAAAVVARVLPYADQIVLVAPASADAPRAVSMTFEWLDGHGYHELRSRAVTVINGVSRRSMDDVEQAEAVARGRCRALVRIPWDDHLSMDRAPRNELKSLRAPTRRAYLALAGVVAGGFTVVPERYQELQQEQEATR
ncbi:TcpE family conjugal transfer membrane protein [Spirillospora sp. CA-253888]